MAEPAERMVLLGRTATKSSNGPPRLETLDVLRGVAIISVVLFHAFVVRPPHGSWEMRFIGQGAEGVGLFFILSALTIGLSWDWRKTQDQNPRYAFWARRFWRIVPLFYLVLVATPLLTQGQLKFAPPLMATPFTWRNFLAHITFVFGWIPAYQNSWIGVEWSLGAEMSFYLLFPWIAQSVLPRLKPEGFLIASAGLAWIWPVMMTHIPALSWPHWAYAFLLWAFPSQLMWFAMGLWIWQRRAWRPKSWLWALLWGAVAIVIANHVWNPRWERFAWLLPDLLLVWIAWHDLPAMRWFTHLRPLAFLGKRSYSVYLIHWLVLKAVVLPWIPGADAATVDGFVIRTATVLALTLGLAELSFHYVEKPGIAWGKTWIRRRGWAEKPPRPLPEQHRRNTLGG